MMEMDYFNEFEDDAKETKEDENFQIGDKESCLFEAVWQDDSSRLISLANQRPEETLDPAIASRLLQIACRLDSVECARVLIEGDAGTMVRINEMDGSGRTPLQTAAGMHSTKCIDLLLEKNARTDLRSKDRDSLLALEIALSSKRMQVNWSPKESVQDLLVLLKERDLSAIRLLAGVTKDVAKVSYMRAMEGRIVELASLLLVAADKIIAPVSISGEGSLSAKKGRTIYESVLEEAMALFVMEKRVQSNDKQAKYVWHSVQFYEKRRKLLLHAIELIQMFSAVVPAAGNNCKKQKALPPLLQALQIGDESVAKLLLEAGADTSETDADGNSVLHLCLKTGSFPQNLRLVWLLLRHGAKVSQKNRLGLTPVHVAAEKGNYQALQILLLQDPECVDLASETQETPLFFAARNGFLDCTKLLLQCGADCQAINLRRQRPIDLASSQDIRFVLNQGFLFHTSSPQGDDDRDMFRYADKELNEESHKGALGMNHKLTNSESTKRDICRYYDSVGGCVRGANCNFAHGEGELRRGKIGQPELKPVSSFRNITRHPQQATVMDRKIFIGGLPFSVDSDYLKEFFQAEFGPVEDAIVITTKVGSQFHSKGFGFIIFKQEETVATAVEARFVTIFGKKVEIKSAEAPIPSLKQPQLSSQPYQKDPDRQPLGSLSEHIPPWLLKFRKWLPVFLKGAFKRLGYGVGYPLSSLKADFRATCGMELDHLSLGFLKLGDFMRTFPELCKMRVVPVGNGLASHMVLFPLNSTTHHELLQSSGQHPQPYPSSRGVEPLKSPPTPEVSEDGSSSSESKARERANIGYAGFGEGSLNSNPWKKVLDSLQLRLTNTGLTGVDHDVLCKKQGGAGGWRQPPSEGGKGAAEASQLPYFSLFERQWDLYAGLCTVCFFQPVSLAIIPCHHSVCLRCFKDSIQRTCTICSVSVQGFRYLENA